MAITFLKGQIVAPIETPANVKLLTATEQELNEVIEKGLIKDRYRESFSLKAGDDIKVKGVGIQKYDMPKTDRETGKVIPGEREISYGYVVGILLTRNGKTEDKTISLNTLTVAMEKVATDLRGIQDADIPALAKHIAEASKQPLLLEYTPGMTNQEYIEQKVNPIIDSQATARVGGALRCTLKVESRNGVTWPIGYRSIFFIAA